MTRRTTFRGLVAAAGLLGLTTPAAAGLLPVRVSVSPEGEQFRWTYAIVLPTDSQLRSGDYFTIYDFGGLVAGSNSQPAGWTYASENLGTTPDRLLPGDRADLPNLTWTYTGPTLTAGQTGLGNFWAISAFQDAADSTFTASTHRTSDGKVDNNITDTVVPVPTGTVSGVPEPTTLALAGLGLPLAARLLRRKKA